MEYLDYICPAVCLLLCILHGIIEFVSARKVGKKIDHLCDKCGSPVYQSVPHLCVTDYLGNVIEFSAEDIKPYADLIATLTEKEFKKNGHDD